MPVASLTPRQLRTIADRVEALTKARHDNQAMGVPTTPDVFDCRFPSGHRGTVTWTEASLSSATARARNGGQPVYRYVVELHDDTATGGDEHTTVIALDPATDVQQAIASSLDRAEAQRRRLLRETGG